MYGTDEYLESQVMTASPYHLHLIVIDGAIRHAARAAEAMENKDFESAHFALNDSRGFIAELISGLNEEQAPEVVRPLKELFLFAFRNLVDADLHRDVQQIRDALQVLHMHRETWIELAGRLDDVQSGESIAGAPPRPHISPSAADDEGRSWTS